MSRIRHLTRMWLAENRIGWCEVRFEVLAVYCAPDSEPRVAHLTAVF